jgi:hypothetical protein
MRLIDRCAAGKLCEFDGSRVIRSGVLVFLIRECLGCAARALCLEVENQLDRFGFDTCCI